MLALGADILALIPDPIVFAKLLPIIPFFSFVSPLSEYFSVVGVSFSCGCPRQPLLPTGVSFDSEVSLAVLFVIPDFSE